MSKSNGERLREALDEAGALDIVIHFRGRTEDYPAAQAACLERAANEYDKARADDRSALERERDSAIGMATTSAFTNHSLITTCKALQQEVKRLEALAKQWQSATGADSPEELTAALNKWRKVVGKS